MINIGDKFIGNTTRAMVIIHALTLLEVSYRYDGADLPAGTMPRDVFLRNFTPVVAAEPTIKVGDKFRHNVYRVTVTVAALTLRDVFYTYDDNSTPSGRRRESFLRHFMPVDKPAGIEPAYPIDSIVEIDASVAWVPAKIVAYRGYGQYLVRLSDGRDIKWLDHQGMRPSLSSKVDDLVSVYVGGFEWQDAVYMGETGDGMHAAINERGIRKYARKHIKLRIVKPIDANLNCRCMPLYLADPVVGEKVEFRLTTHGDFTSGTIGKIFQPGLFSVKSHDGTYVIGIEDIRRLTKLPTYKLGEKVEILDRPHSEWKSAIYGGAREFGKHIVSRNGMLQQVDDQQIRRARETRPSVAPADPFAAWRDITPRDPGSLANVIGKVKFTEYYENVITGQLRLAKGSQLVVQVDEKLVIAAVVRE